MVKHKNNTARKLVKRFSLGSLLMLSTSLGGTFCVMEKFEPEIFPDQVVKINDADVPIEDFYENIKKIDDVWYLRNFNGNSVVNLYDFSDYRINGDMRHRNYLNAPLREFVDTVHVRRNDQTSKVFYSFGASDTVPNMPLLGYFVNDELRVRHFVSQDSVLANKYKHFNNDYNCTRDHEYQHFLNARAGINKSGQSYETKYVEACFDEVSANIAQLLAQRKNYLKHGRNLQYLTNRFKFYKEWVEQRNKPLSDTISEEEIKFIALGTLDMWQKERFPLYKDKNAGRAIFILKTANYSGCVDHPELHNQLMYRMFQINGIDFYKYIQGKEDFFRENIPQEHRDRFAEIMQKKKEKVSYLQKVGMKFEGDNDQKDNYFRSVQMKHRWNKFWRR